MLTALTLAAIVSNGDLLRACGARTEATAYGSEARQGEMAARCTGYIEGVLASGYVDTAMGQPLYCARDITPEKARRLFMELAPLAPQQIDKEAAATLIVILAGKYPCPARRH